MLSCMATIATQCPPCAHSSRTSPRTDRPKAAFRESCQDLAGGGLVKSPTIFISSNAMRGHFLLKPLGPALKPSADGFFRTLRPFEVELFG